MIKHPLTPEVIELIKSRRMDERYNAMMRIGDISKLHRDIARHESEQEGMPSSYRMILFHLDRMEPGVTQLQLVKATHLKPPTISVTLQKMEADDLVIRKSNEHDLRQTLVYLSEYGKSINNKMRASFDSIDRIALNGISEDEQDQLCRILDKVIENLIAARKSD